MNPNTDKLIRRTTMVGTVVAAYFLLTADYGTKPNVLDPVCFVIICVTFWTAALKPVLDSLQPNILTKVVKETIETSTIYDRMTNDENEPFADALIKNTIQSAERSAKEFVFGTKKRPEESVAGKTDSSSAK